MKPKATTVNAYGRHYNRTKKPHTKKIVYGKATKPKPITESWWIGDPESFYARAAQRANDWTFTSRQIEGTTDYLARSRTPYLIRGGVNRAGENGR